MSKKAKITRSKIKDLPEIANELPAEELNQVAGGLIRSPLGGFRFGGASLGATSTQPASITEPGQVDTATDSDQ